MVSHNIASVSANNTFYKAKCQLSMGPWNSQVLPHVPLSSKHLSWQNNEVFCWKLSDCTSQETASCLARMWPYTSVHHLISFSLKSECIRERLKGSSLPSLHYPVQCGSSWSPCCKWFRRPPIPSKVLEHTMPLVLLKYFSLLMS